MRLSHTCRKWRRLQYGREQRENRVRSDERISTSTSRQTVLTSSWVDGKPEARIAEVAVECLARHAGLHSAVKIFGVYLDDLIHLEQIEADAALA